MRLFHRAEPVEPDDDALETAAVEVVERLQAERLILYGKLKGNTFRDPIPIDNILDATEVGAPIYGGSFLGESPRLTWAIIPDNGEDVIQNRDRIFWEALAVKKADLLALLAAVDDDGVSEPPIADEASEGGEPHTIGEARGSDLDLECEGSTKADPMLAYKTGGPGRPSPIQLVEREAERRRASGEAIDIVKEEAKYLHGWCEREHSKAPTPTPKTIENRIRIDHRTWKAGKQPKNPQN